MQRASRHSPCFKYIQTREKPEDHKTSVPSIVWRVVSVSHTSTPILYLFPNPAGVFLRPPPTGCPQAAVPSLAIVPTYPRARLDRSPGSARRQPRGNQNLRLQLRVIAYPRSVTARHYGESCIQYLKNARLWASQGGCGEPELDNTHAPLVTLPKFGLVLSFHRAIRLPRNSIRPRRTPSSESFLPILIHPSQTPSPQSCEPKSICPRVSRLADRPTRLSVLTNTDILQCSIPQSTRPRCTLVVFSKQLPYPFSLRRIVY